MDTFTEIKLNGWRQFSSVDISLDADVTVLTGSNGCGKTTILNVLARHFGWNMNFVATPYTNNKTRTQWWSDVWKDVINDNQIHGHTEVGSIGYSNGTACQLYVPSNHAQYSLMYNNQSGIVGLHIPSHRPTFSYFQIQNIPTNPKTNQQHHQEFQQLLWQTYSSNHGQNPGVILKQSLVSLALFGYGNEFVQPNLEYRDLFERFQEIISLLLPKTIGFRRLEVRIPEIVLVTDSGDFPLDAMSGGVGAIFGMAWQIHMYGADKEKCTVIIDEPENHLHPSMQREFLGRLRSAFPRYKFIVSTHSPFVVSSDPLAKVYGLVYDDNKKVVSHCIEHGDLAGSANKILREILDVPTTIPKWVEDRINTVLAKHDGVADDLEKADRVFRELKELGLNDLLSEFVPEEVEEQK